MTDQKMTCRVCGKPVHEVEGKLVHDQPYDPWMPPIHAPMPELQKRYRYGSV